MKTPTDPAAFLAPLIIFLVLFGIVAWFTLGLGDLFKECIQWLSGW